MIGYLCNLPKADYKYTLEERIELLDMYVNGEWEAYPDRNIRQGIFKGATLAFLIWGFLPALVVCLVSWIINVPDINVGGLIVMGVIHAILIILGIVGIIHFFYLLASDGDNSVADLAEREANAHGQALKQLSEELREKVLYCEELKKDNEILTKEYLKLKKLNANNSNANRKLKNKLLDRETTIAKLKSSRVKNKKIENDNDDIDNSIGIEAMFEEVK